MKCNFYLDRPYHPKIDSQIIQREKKKAKEKKKRIPNRFLNPKSTSVYIFLSPDKSTRIKYRTSIKVQAKNWDFLQKKVRTTAPGSLDLNMKLDELSNKIIKSAYALADKKDSVTRKEFKKILADIVDGKNVVKDEDKLIPLINEFKKKKSKYVKDGTMKEYRTVFKALEDFQKEQSKLSLMDFDKGFYMRFESFLSKKKKPTKKESDSNEEQGLLNDTIYKYVSTLRVFLRWCHENGHTVHPYTFKNHKSPFKKKARNEIVVLTEDELKKLENHDFSKKPSLERVRDLFLFMAYTGQRFSDAIRFTKADLHKDRWTFISYKTGKQVTVPFHGYIAKGLDILREYDFEFKKITNQKFNQYIKEVGKEAGIDTPVRKVRYRGKEEVIQENPKYKFMTSHMGRRTAVTILLSRGVPVTLVQKLTQHSKISTLMKYESADTNSLIDALTKY